ncbi:hypothetical protein BB561_006701 [Smittium simulii]|uniref:Uncharacterized protein n=1 Tax=Smittium simulii TaxID=133385 RepID=A0A2T9Y268_9FUNG|nr:hypothetical protein BB561_006701 [Smittium simulii]
MNIVDRTTIRIPFKSTVYTNPTIYSGIKFICINSPISLKSEKIKSLEIIFSLPNKNTSADAGKMVKLSDIERSVVA